MRKLPREATKTTTVQVISFVPESPSCTREEFIPLQHPSLFLGHHLSPSLQCLHLSLFGGNEKFLPLILLHDSWSLVVLNLDIRVDTNNQVVTHGLGLTKGVEMT